MNRQVRQVLGLSVFAAGCMALGMGLSYRWVGAAQEEKPVVVDAKGLDRLPPIADVAEKLNPTVVAITNTSFVKNRRWRRAIPRWAARTSSTGSSAPSAPAARTPQGRRGAADPGRRLRRGHLPRRRDPHQQPRHRRHPGRGHLHRSEDRRRAHLQGHGAGQGQGAGHRPHQDRRQATSPSPSWATATPCASGNGWWPSATPWGWTTPSPRASSRAKGRKLAGGAWSHSSRRTPPSTVAIPAAPC